MRGPDADARERTRTAPPGPETRTFGDQLPPTATPPHAPDTRPSPAPLADRSTPSGPPGFDLLGKIGEGGMGTVQKARDVRTGRVVALKVLKLNVFDERVARERFDREVRVMARIEHPHLVPLYQSGEHNGVPYFTMKYMPGGTLSAVRTGGPLSPPRAAELLRAIAGGVAALHAAGILHRDLKPANVLLDEDGTPHVADFGLVKWVDDDEHTQTGVRNGTPQYMSPEQVAGRSRKLTAACDVWALGVIGYELACGRRPFDHDDREDLYRAISNDPPPDPYSLAPDLLPPLAQILLCCLSKDPLARYPSAAELVADVDRFLAGQPVQATELVTITRQQRVNRRRWLAVAGAAFGVGAVGGLGATAYFLTRKKEATPPEPTFAELVVAALKRGETVELIGETGLPKWHAIYPDGAVTVAEDADGGVRVGLADSAQRASPFGYFELFADPIPVPVRVEAEIAYRQPPARNSQLTAVGLYAGRRAWGSASGEWHTAVAVRHRPAVLRVPELVMFDVLADQPPAQWQDQKIVLGRRQPPARPVAFGGWMPFAIAAGGERVEGESCGGTAAADAPVTAGLVRTKLTQVAESAKTIRVPVGNDTRPAFAMPDFASALDPLGCGVGVHIRAAEVAVRNVRLIPLPSPQERP